MAGGMQAEDHFCSRRFFNAQALGANGHAAIAADFERGAHAPDISPPRTAWGRAQSGAVSIFRPVPGLSQCLAQLTMDLMAVVMEAQRVNVAVGFGQFGNFLAREISGQAALPELMLACDFAFGLGSGGVAQAHIIESE